MTRSIHRIARMTRNIYRKVRGRFVRGKVTEVKESVRAGRRSGKRTMRQREVSRGKEPRQKSSVTKVGKVL